MRTALAVLLVALVAVLPAMDVVACPDGCSNPVHSDASWTGADTGGSTAACGLCLNAFFLARDVTSVRHRARVVLAPVVPRLVCLAGDPPSFDRPPRSL
ncbi:MAG TPA: hypothetical protein VFA43_13495 [Gemmatimonadaceae bacterium]|nr:hypothetical protein [Gemmatimonadaceae bacterium]